MGVRKHDGVEFARLAAKVPILGVSLGSMSLEQSAVEQNAERVGFEQMLTAGDLSRGAEKSQPHRDGGGEGRGMAVELFQKSMPLTLP